MRKQSKSFKSIVKKLSAPVILLFGLVAGFVVDRVFTLLTSHPAAPQIVEKLVSVPGVCPPAAAAAPAKKLLKVAHHKKAAHKHHVAAAKKSKSKKAQRVASSK